MRTTTPTEPGGQRASKPARPRAVVLDTPDLAQIGPNHAAWVVTELTETKEERRRRMRREAARRRRGAPVPDRTPEQIAADLAETERLRRAASEASRRSNLAKARKARRAFVQDVEFMASTGETVEGAAVRLGLSVKTFHKKLTEADRCHRPDLWEQLRRNEQRPEPTVTYDGTVAGGFRGVAC